MHRKMRQAHHDIVVDRIRALMSEADLDVLVALKNENFTYVSTAASPFLTQSGVATIAMVVVPKDGEVFAICPDFERPALDAESAITHWHDFPMWIYIDDQFAGGKKAKKEARKHETFLLASSVGLLAEKLREVGADKGKIGVEMLAIQAPIWNFLQSTFPDATFVDSSSLFYKARAVKTAYEIECLEHAARAQEDVVFGSMAEVRVGMPHAKIMSKLRSKALASPGIDSIRFMYVSVGPLFSPTVTPYEVEVKNGDLVKYDGALVTRGYGADAAYTFIVGKPSKDQRRISDLLLRAQKEAVGMMGPGIFPRDVFNRIMKLVNENGLPDYSRGHIGHSVGLDHVIEEPPFISATSEEPMKPGNVFCVELPYYAHGFGSIQNEDIVLITEDGKRMLTQRERGLHPIGPISS
jgi:Xaa-Pro dipeptidase